MPNQAKRVAVEGMTNILLKLAEEKQIERTVRYVYLKKLQKYYKEEHKNL